MVDFAIFAKDCLRSFNYPRIHSLNEEEIAQVFHSSNRCFLVAWMLKTLDQAYEEVLSGNENDKELLANLIYEHGFCTKNQKDGFISGQISAEVQVEIIYRMLNFIKNVKSDVKFTIKTISLADIETVKNRNLNLFPMYGEIKTFSDVEKETLIQTMQAEIAELQQVENNHIEVGGTENLSEKILEITEVVEKIKSCFPEVKAALKAIKHENRDVQEKIEVNERSREILKKCCEYLTILSKFSEDMGVIKRFVEDEKKLSLHKNPKVEELCAMVKRVSDELLCLTV